MNTISSIRVKTGILVFMPGLNGDSDHFFQDDYAMINLQRFISSRGRIEIGKSIHFSDLLAIYTNNHQMILGQEEVKLVYWL